MMPKKTSRYFSYLSTLLVIGAIVFFVMFKWHTTDLRWNGRLMPPEPDDSFAYIAETKKITDTGSYFYDLKYILPWNHMDHLTYLTWKTGLAIVKLFGDFSYFDVYKISFYFGIILMSLTILYIVKVLEKDKLFWVFSFLFLSLFNGKGEYHGFYWVVPSFYSLAASLLLISLVFDIQGSSNTSKKRWSVLLFLITFLTVFSHPLGKYSYAAIVFSFVIYILLNFFLGNSTKALLRRAKLIIAYGAIAIFSLEVLPLLGGILPSQSFSLVTIAQQISESSGFPLFRTLYLDAFTTNPSYTVLLAIGLFATLFNKKISLLSIYLGFFTLSLAASFFDTLAYRMLLYLWPLTFLIFSYGCYSLARGLIDTFKKSSESKVKIKFKKYDWNMGQLLNKDTILLTSVIVLISINYVYPFVQNNYNNNINPAIFDRTRNDWKVDKSIVSYLDNVTKPGDLIIFEDKNAFVTTISLGLSDREVAYADWNWTIDWTALLPKVNGSYLVATGTLDRDRIFNLMEAFQGRLVIFKARDFGILGVYHLTVGQNKSPYSFEESGSPYLVTPVEPEIAQLIADDNQTAFWSRWGDAILLRDDNNRLSGNNALKISLSQTKMGQNNYFYHTYEAPQDWSDKDELTFDWCGTGSGKKIEVLIFASQSTDLFAYEFTDLYIGWKLVSIPLGDFTVRGGPSWQNVKTIIFRFTLDSPYNQTFYLDRLLLTIKSKEVDMMLMSDNVQIFEKILISFFLLLFPLGLIWAFYVFRVRDLIMLVALSFGLSLVLIFLALFLLNLALGLTITKVSAMLTIAILIALPPAFYYLNKIIKVSPRFSKGKTCEE